MGQMGKFESKEKTQKKGQVERKGCFFECLIFLFGVVIVVLLNIPDDSLSGLEVFDIGVIALFLICGMCSGVYGIYKMIRKRKNKNALPWEKVARRRP